MNTPLVSIIVPVYNVEHFLAECLESLVNQIYQYLEIIVINDGSTDQSLSIAKQYAKLDNRIQIISQKNAGLSAARNIGIAYAKGDYICFLDSDDWIDLNTIEKSVEIAESTKVDVVLWNYTKEYKTKSEEVHCIIQNQYFDAERIHLLRQRIVGPIGKQLSEPQFLDSLSTAWGKLYKRELIKDNHIEYVSTKEIGTEDLLFNVQVFQHVTSAFMMTDCYSHYRKYNSTSLTSVYKPDLFPKWRNLQDRLWKIIENDPILVEAFLNRIVLTMIGLGLNLCFSNLSFLESRKQIKMYLKTSVYHEAYKQLQLKDLPFHWKLCLGSAKLGYYSVFLLMIKIVNKIRK